MVTSPPAVQPSQYRQKRHLTSWPKRHCEEDRWLLPRDRVNLQLETATECPPNWTIEEIQTWLDWGEKEQDEIGQREEEELI